MNDLLHGQKSGSTGPVECLGQTFPSEQARREHYLALLAQKLKDPAFRQQEGFPQGTDEAILAMSDPPYYTACPNPWLSEFVAHYGKPYEPAEKYSREPLAIDVSVGKTDAIYKAHSYHTKVPHLAIVPSILHYTEPGDVVLDGFAGSGMTGVAAQWCGTAPTSYRFEVEMALKKEGRAAPKWGARRAVLNDLSPAATFIATNNNQLFDIEQFAEAAKKLLNEAEREIGWMYKTKHTDGTKAHITYVVWSEVFICRSCLGETVFFNAAYDPAANKVRDQVTCAHCGAEATKEHMDLKLESFMDAPNNVLNKRPKRVPVLIKYSIGRSSFTKTPDPDDLEILEKVSKLAIPSSLPTVELPDCQMTRVGRMRTTNTGSVHHMYLPRAGYTLSYLWEKASLLPDVRLRNQIKYWLDSQFTNMSILNRYRPEVSFPYNPLSGVFYVPSLVSEADPFTAYKNKIKRLVTAFSTNHAQENMCITSCGSTTSLPVSNETVDYIFTDPPFGENIYYADLNILVEAWHSVLSEAKTEAIVDRVRGKGISEYQNLMRACFNEYYRVLKPGRWMTVVFSNSRASVWNAIQVALQQVGFVVAEVTALDKVQGSFQQVTSPNVVKQDLVISAYKPNGGLEERFVKSGATVDSAWDFVQTHLRNLPVIKLGKDGELDTVAERNPRRIYDRMVAWFVRHDSPVPLSSPEFLGAIFNRFPERDGMAFLPEQIALYDKNRAQSAQAPQMEMFVSDERSAIDWLWDFLKSRPSNYSEVHPEFTRQLGAGWKKHEARPELSALLEANFLRYEGSGDVPSQIHSYLSTNHKDMRGLEKSDPRLIAKARDRWFVPDPNNAKQLEEKREKALLKEFEIYKAFTGRKIKESRLEVLRAGFRAAWAAKDYKTIISIANKLPEETLQEDEKLLTLYDLALTRTEDGI